MGVGAGLYMCDVVKKSSRSLSHLLMSSCMRSFYYNQGCKRDVSLRDRDETETSNFCHDTRPRPRPCKAETETFFETFNPQHYADAESPKRMRLGAYIKSSAVAEQGDRLATIDICRKVGELLCPCQWGGELGSYLTQCRLGRGLPP